MKAQIRFHQKQLTVDLTSPMNISLPVSRSSCNPNAYFLPEANFIPFRAGTFVGSVAEGGPCNCEIISLSPHGNGTHTECVGHISVEPHFIKDSLKSFFVLARLKSLAASKIDNDYVVLTRDVENALQNFDGTAFVLRTLPNTYDKVTRHWSGTNPLYCQPGVGLVLREKGIEHFLLDLPSVDREEDNGVLTVHHEFWNYPVSPRLNATITEMIYVPDSVPDGDYFLQFSLLALESDASPSQIFLYSILGEA